MDFERSCLLSIISLALREDKFQSDITTQSLMKFDKKVTAEVIAKEAGIISGIEVFSETFLIVDPQIKISALKKDGSPLKKNTPVCLIDGKESSILCAERTALNFLQRLSGIASQTDKFVKKINNPDITLLDTRKTTPGMRYLEKKAVKDGGGTNHRLNLEEMAMVKDNHIKMAGSITKAVKEIRTQYPGKRVEVEVKNHEELLEVIPLDVDVIMLDNFSAAMIQKAVKIKPGKTKFEVSGQINLANINQKTLPGIDFISVGALTHSFPSLDFSLNIRR